MSNTVPEGWDYCRLDKLVSKFLVPMRDKPKVFSGEVPWVRIEDFNGKYLYESKSKRCVDEHTIKKMKLKVYPKGTVLCSCSARLGVCTIAGRGLVSNQTFIGLVPKPSVISSEFLYYRMQSHADDLQNLSSGTTIAYLSREKFEEFHVLAPPPSEQRKIVAILSSVDDVIEKTRAQIDKLKDLKTGMMQELLSKGIGSGGVTHTEFKDSLVGRIPIEWEVRTIQEVLRKVIDYRGKSPPKSERGVPLITAKNIRQGYIDTEPREFIGETQYDSWMVRGIPSSGDVFITTEAPLGNVARVPEYKFAIGQRVLALCPADSIITDYLLYIMQSRYFQEQLVLQSTGSTVAGIKQSTFRNILIPVPLKEEQERIVGPINALNNRIDAVSEKLSHFNRLKKALMQDLLTGKVRVKINKKEKESAVA